MAPCACQISRIDEGQDAFAVLESVRAECPALREVFLPDDVWPEFKAWHAKPDEVALHCSMLVLALDRGHLERLTLPVHRYLLDGDRLRTDVRANYVKDLRERWMHYADHLERHRK